MSCGCHCNPCQCEETCDSNNESVVSTLNNFIGSFFGSVTKTCVNGQVVWLLPCDLDGTPVAGFPRVPNEGLACYFARIMGNLVGTSAGQYINGDVPIGVVDGVNRVFTLMSTSIVGKDSGYLNGVRVQRGLDYTLIGQTITFNVAPPLLSTLLWDYFVLMSNPSGYVNGDIPTGLVDGINTVFTLANVPSSLKDSGFMNGVRQQRSLDYTISGSTITFLVAPPIGSTLLWDYFI